MSSTRTAGNRYQIGERLGGGGMGEVYSALDLDYDPPREVVIKTIRDASDPVTLDLFKRECAVLMSFTHPNVIEIYATGDSGDRNGPKPFFVMAKLQGHTLAELIENSPQDLTVQRTIEIIVQVCRGLQAAHEKGLVHRDIKPSNIFVLHDDSVKVIDFGVAHLASTATIGAKGTLYYMAPEQFEGKPVTAATDVFSLGVVCFEALTRRRPFVGANPYEIRAAIRKSCPPAISSLNPAVSAALSQVIHASMAKKPHNRFASAREFGECLKKALRNEPIERFEPGKLQLRLSRVEKALEASQFEVAGEILSEIEEEGYLHPTVSELRRQVDLALRNRDIRQFLESARRFEAQEEYTLALQKVQDALELEATNTEALDLRSTIEAKRSSQLIGNWLNLAQKHLSNLAFEPAREAVSSVLHMLPTDATALRLMTEINRVEQEVLRKREEKERFFDSAVELRKKGDLTAALSRLQRVLELDGEAPDPLQPERGTYFQTFYNEVRSESESIRNALDEAKKELDEKNYATADHICATFLEKYPNHALFQALKFDIGERQRLDLSAYIAEVDRAVEAEPDLDRKAKLLEQALSRYPDEAHFERALKGVNAKRELINGLVSQARNLEDRGQYSEAIDKWELLRSIYHRYPGLDFEVDRIRRRLEQQTRSEAKARWIERIDSALNSGDYARARNLVSQALVESPQDAQLVPLERLVRQRLEQSNQAQTLLEQGQRLLENKSFDEALQALESAHSLDEQSVLIRAIYIQAILGKAAAIVDADLPAAEKLVEAAFALDAANASVKNMRVLVSDRKRSSAIDHHLSKARELQATSELDLALAEVEKGLAAFPGDVSLVRLQSSLEANRQSELRKDRGKILSRKPFDATNDDSLLGPLMDESLMLPRKPKAEDAETIPGKAEGEMAGRQAAAIVTPPPAKVSDPQTGVPSEKTTVTESTDAELPENTKWLPSAPHLFRKPLFIALGIILIITSLSIAKWINRPPRHVETHSIPSPPPPPPDVKRVGNAVARSAITLLKDPVEPGVNVASVNAQDLLQILERIPPSSNNDEWVFVRPVGQPANRGYVRLGDLDRVDTGDHHFDLSCALASIMKSVDYADVMSRLESLQLAESEPGDIYLGLAQAYVHLTELAISDKNAAKTALNKAKDYLKRAALQSPEASESLEGSIQLLDKRLAPAENQQPDPGKILLSAKTAYQRGMMLEASSDVDNALKQYLLAKTLCERIKNVPNPEAEALRENISKAIVRVALKK